MMTKNKIQVFENKKVRALWDEEQEKWYYSIVDIKIKSRKKRNRYNLSRFENASNRWQNTDD